MKVTVWRKVHYKKIVSITSSFVSSIEDIKVTDTTAISLMKLLPALNYDSTI